MTDGRRSDGKRARTRARLLTCALDLFEAHGYEQTAVSQIAAAAGVSEMTFYRHFTAKEQVVVDDPYDPLIAAAVGAQPRALSPLARTARGVRSAWAQLPAAAGEVVRRRIRVAATAPSLRAAVWAANARTEHLIAEQLIADGTPPLRARVAAAAVLAALVAALFEWAQQDKGSLATAIAEAMTTLDDIGE